MVSIVKQTWQERYDMYMKLTKEELARMMAENDRVTNPDGCTDAIYINGNKPYVCENHFFDNNQASEIVKDNCSDNPSYSPENYINESQPTGITYIG